MTPLSSSMKGRHFAASDWHLATVLAVVAIK
jgi:hypothetical protein